MIGSHETRIVNMRLGPESESVGGKSRATNLNSLILGIVKFVKLGYQFEAGPTRCKLSNVRSHGNVVQNSLWVDVRAYTTAQGTRIANARLVAPVVME